MRFLIVTARTHSIFYFISFIFELHFFRTHTQLEIHTQTTVIKCAVSVEPSNLIFYKIRLYFSSMDVCDLTNPDSLAVKWSMTHWLAAAPSHLVKDLGSFAFTLNSWPCQISPAESKADRFTRILGL